MADAAESQPPGRGKLVVLTILITTLFWTVVWGGFALARGRPQPAAFAVQPPPATATAAPTATPVPTAKNTPTLPAATPAATAASASRAGSLALDMPVEDASSVVGASASATASATAAPPAGGSVTLININTASAAELESLPSIGPKTAAAIIAYREEHGPFATVEALTDVKGIGPATLEKLRALITID